MDKPEITRFLTRPKGLAALLAMARQMANLTTRQLGSLLGSSSSKISKVEKGVQTVTRAEVEAWAGACSADAEARSTLLAAWDDFNATFPPVAGRARCSAVDSYVPTADDVPFRAGYRQGYAAAVRDMQTRLDDLWPLTDET